MQALQLVPGAEAAGQSKAKLTPSGVIQQKLMINPSFLLAQGNIEKGTWGGLRAGGGGGSAVASPDCWSDSSAATPPLPPRAPFSTLP